MAEKKTSLAQAIGVEKKRLRSQSLQTLCKTRVGKAEQLISAADLEAAKTAVLSAVATLDKAAEKGILHPNNTARRKSRLIKKLNQALTAPAPAPVEKKKTTKKTAKAAKEPEKT